MFSMKILDKLKTFTKSAPEAMQDFWVFDRAAFTEGSISVLNKQLMAVSVALTTQCPYCIEIHTASARQAGATNEQLAEVAVVSAAIRAGGTSGVGRATARRFAAGGAKVIISGRDEQRGHDVAAETGGQFVWADLDMPKDIELLACEADEVDVLVSNAGYWELATTADTTRSGFEAMVDVNFRAPFFLTAALGPQMA